MYDSIIWLILLVLIAAYYTTYAIFWWRSRRTIYVCPNCGNRFTLQEHNRLGWDNFIERRRFQVINTFTASKYVYVKCRACKTYEKCRAAYEERRK